jgi:hypothetical protein
MKKDMKTGALASVLLLTTSGATVQASQVETVQSQELGSSGIRISDGKLVLDGETALEAVSLFQSRFSFLFIYVPDQGLWTVAARDFDGATEAGSFRGSELTIDLEDVSFRVESSLPILGRDETAAWARLDRSFTLEEVDSVLFGYGDRHEDAYAWQDLLHPAR